MLAAEIIGNETLLKSVISNNSIKAEGSRALAEAFKYNQVIEEPNDLSPPALIHPHTILR
jgi:hypothetical protein